MSKATEKSFIKKALAAISNGNATEMKNNIREALVSKVKRALDIREKQLAKTLIDNATKK